MLWCVLALHCISTVPDCRTVVQPLRRGGMGVVRFLRSIGGSELVPNDGPWLRVGLCKSFGESSGAKE